MLIDLVDVFHRRGHIQVAIQKQDLMVERAGGSRTKNCREQRTETCWWGGSKGCMHTHSAATTTTTTTTTHSSSSSHSNSTTGNAAAPARLHHHHHPCRDLPVHRNHILCGHEIKHQ